MRSARLALVPALAVAVSLAAVPAARADLPYPPGDFYVTEPADCVAGSCRIPVRYESAADEQPSFVEVDWLAPGADDASFHAAGRLACAPAVDDFGDPITACTGTSPVYRKPADGFIAIRVTDSDGTRYAAAEPVLIDSPSGLPSDGGPGPGSGTPPSGSVPAQTIADACTPRRPKVSCGSGRGRRASPGGANVSHKGWPVLTGILWKVLDSTGRSQVGTAGNDELLGHHGSDTLAGGDGNDILWGDWDPKHAGMAQVDVLDGGAGADWIYTSRGRTTVRGGAGDDHVTAYGRGTIDCGPGNDVVRLMPGSRSTTRQCERVSR